MFGKSKNNPARLILIATTASLFFIFLLTASAEAMTLNLQRPFGALQQSIEVSGSSIGEYILAAYGFGSAAVVALAIVMIIVGGVQWVLSGGSPDAISKAKDTIFKSFLGMFIALFSVFMLSIVNPGAVKFASITPEGIVGVADPNLEFDSTPTATCTDDHLKNCGENYTDPYSNPCIGKKCSTATEVCSQQSDNSWKCEACGPVDSACSKNENCCSGICKDSKCKDSETVSEKLGQHCNNSSECDGLICETNWINACNYGRAGMPCSSDDECNQAEGYYCGKDGRNQCIKKIQWGWCDPSNKKCPTGYKCVDEPPYCKKGVNGCTYTDSFVAMAGMALCIPDGVDCLCNCDKDSDCAGSTVGGKICQNDGYDYCSPGTYGSACQPDTRNGQTNPECTTGYCNTEGVNQCTQGKIGEGCADKLECQSGLQCCKHVCMPGDFTCP